MVFRTPKVSFTKRPDILVVELNAAWAEARAGKATRSETIARYVTAGLKEEDAALMFDIQWKGYVAFPNEPGVGDLGVDQFPAVIASRA